MNPLKKLAGQTAIYGLPSIVGRLLNYLLVPLHTKYFLLDQYGVITEMYAYVAFLVVILTYGMETAFFRFQTRKGNEKAGVFSTVVISLIISTVFFWIFACLFSQQLADAIHHPNHSNYVVWFAFIVGMDAISSIPLARLRIENKAKRFAFVNFASILVNIALNLFWVGYCIPAYQAGDRNLILQLFYHPGVGIGYVFLANLIASGVKFLLLSPVFLKIKLIFNRALLKKMLFYAAPLLISSLAIIINESADKILLKWLLVDKLGDEGSSSVVGIYGGVYKLSIIITLFIQAFRYAAEPFFFSEESSKNARDTYALVMKYFVIVCSLIFLGVMMYIDILKYFLSNKAYWEGLKVVPILLFANIFLGLYYNLSIWYKLNNQTRFGAYIAIFGATITISLNFILIPIIGYVGSAWATFICYACMVVVAYFLGQKFYPIPYNVKRILTYLGVSFGLYLFSEQFNFSEGVLKYAFHTLLIIGFIAFVFVIEKPKKALIS